ncbi:MAG: deoxyribose-phosphate aldolase [Chloroflexi bacterium]|nr:deoxyribose-phosphate aldolase [Chloroflexota bacterium]
MDALTMASMIDHTLLKPDATPAMIIKLCEEARFYRFATVCVNPVHVKLCLSQLATTEKPKVQVCTVIGFPLGANVEAIKVSEAQTALNHGAKEIDMVINIGALKAGDFFLVQREIASVTNNCHTGRAICKVIIEASLLNEDEKIKACELAREAGADFIKTNTGWTGGATVEDVALMRRVVGTKLGVKAAGGIRTLSDALRLIEAGANRIGSSNSVKIMQELSASRHESQ